MTPTSRWQDTEGSDSISIPNETCGSDKCYTSYEFFSLEAEALEDADSADCDAGQLLILHVRRSDDTPGYPYGFVVVGLRFEYPTS